MTIGEALIVSLIGICVVMAILAIIAVLIILISKIIRTVEKVFSKKKAVAPSAPVAAPVPATDGANLGEVELIGTDEKTAAVIMAIVSQKSDIPLNRLSFKSIRLMDENEKGGNK